MVVVPNILGFAGFSLGLGLFVPHMKMLNLSSDTLHCSGINSALLLLMLFL